jgi:hypothetical protein
MKPRKPLRRVSERQKQVLSEYRKSVRRWWKRISQGPSLINKLPCCSLPGCWRDAEKTPHHIIPRSVRKDLTAVEENFLAVCFQCHNWIHREPEHAYDKGYMGRSHEKLSDIAARRFKPTANEKEAA